MAVCSSTSVSGAKDVGGSTSPMDEGRGCEGVKREQMFGIYARRDVGGVCLRANKKKPKKKIIKNKLQGTVA